MIENGYRDAFTQIRGRFSSGHSQAYGSGCGREVLGYGARRQNGVHSGRSNPTDARIPAWDGYHHRTGGRMPVRARGPGWFEWHGAGTRESIQLRGGNAAPMQINVRINKLSAWAKRGPCLGKENAPANKSKGNISSSATIPVSFRRISCQPISIRRLELYPTQATRQAKRSVIAAARTQRNVVR